MGCQHTPVDDAEWAMTEIASRYGQSLPMSLVGHSLGGRAAILASANDAVQNVVALAPWVYPTDIPRSASERRFLIVHGASDRIASPQRSAALARSLSTQADVSYVLVEGAGHAMLKRHKLFSALATGFALQMTAHDAQLDDRAVGRGSEGRRAMERLGRGEAFIRV